jgi:hypothetical protein
MQIFLLRIISDHRSSGSDSLGEGWCAEAEFHIIGYNSSYEFYQTSIACALQENCRTH